MSKGFADSVSLGMKTIFKGMLGFQPTVEVLPRRMDEEKCLVCVVHMFGVCVVATGWLISCECGVQTLPKRMSEDCRRP